MKSVIDNLEKLIFASRWLQAPLYLGLILAQGVYVYQFMHELFILITKVGTLTEVEVMLIVLGLIDVVMIANLLMMVILGGYETFVSRLNLEGHPDQPEVIIVQIAIHFTFLISALAIAYTDKIMMQTMALSPKNQH